MKELVAVKSVNINGEPIPTINARELHEFLGSKRKFSDWIKNRISKYDFEENVDYITGHKIVTGGMFSSIDYHITLDMAKQLSMVENTLKGREARIYFIACEKKLQAIQQEQSQLTSVDLSKYLTDSGSHYDAQMSHQYGQIIEQVFRLRFNDAEERKRKFREFLEYFNVKGIAYIPVKRAQEAYEYARNIPDDYAVAIDERIDVEDSIIRHIVKDRTYTLSFSISGEMSITENPKKSIMVNAETLPGLIGKIYGGANRKHFPELMKEVVTRLERMEITHAN